MKNYFILVLGIISFSMLFSCYDDDNDIEIENRGKNEQKVSLVKLTPPEFEGKGGVQYTGEFLSFATAEDFFEVYDQLEAALEANDEYIRNLLGVVTDEDELDSLFSVHNLDEFQPLKEFENQYGLHSLRKEIKQQEAAWLAIQGDEFDENDPDDHHIFDTVLRTLLNKDGEVMVDGNIIRHEHWGSVNVLNLDTDAYYQYYNYDDTSENPNVMIKLHAEFDPITNGPGGGGNGGSCKTTVSHTRDYKTSSRRKMKIQVKLQRADPIIFRNNRFVARTRYFNKFLGVWVRKKADLYVKLEGAHQYRNDCDSNIGIFEEKYKYGGEAEAKYVNPTPYGDYTEMAVKNNILYTTHTLWGGNKKVMNAYNGNVTAY